jgi:predicted DNA-binding transcriptional regulator YafY
MNRIDRLTAILIHLQTKRVVKAEEISERFEISLRTVYRDVKALMEAGVPIGSEAGKGYFIVDGYHLPPVMFSQQEASAMLTAGKLVEKMTDASIRKAYESALLKIKAVLNDSEKDHLENLQSSIEVFRYIDPNLQSPNPFMAEVQKAIGQKLVMLLQYQSIKNEETKREVEPIGVVYYSANWHMIAWCRLRNGYRDFRIDLIKSLKPTGANFDARNLLTLQEYFHSLEQAHRSEMEKVVVSFDRKTANYTKSSRVYYGFVSEEEKDDRCHMTFLTGSLRSFGRWLMIYGSGVEIESPDTLRAVMEEMVEELVVHYRGVTS